MMDKRTTLALLLMAALLIVYPAIFMRQEPGRVPQKTETPTTPAKPAEAPVPPTEAVAAPVPPKEAPAVPERTAVVETPLYRAEVASAGGRVQGWELHYRGAKPMAAPGILMSRGLLVNRPGQAPRSVGFTVSTDKVALSAGGGPGELVLTGEDGFGLRITESLVFHPDSYVVDHQLKIENRQEFVVAGWTEPRNSRKHFGALLLGYYDDDGRLVYAGHSGGGFSDRALDDIARKLRAIERLTPPFVTTPVTNERAHWAEPRFVAEVKFSEWTGSGMLRQPTFVGWREDKNPLDVKREQVSMGQKRNGAIPSS